MKPPALTNHGAHGELWFVDEHNHLMESPGPRFVAVPRDVGVQAMRRQAALSRGRALLMAQEATADPDGILSENGMADYYDGVANQFEAEATVTCTVNANHLTPQELEGAVDMTPPWQSPDHGNTT